MFKCNSLEEVYSSEEQPRGYNNNTEWYHAVSSMKMPSLSSCMNSSPPQRYSRIRYNFSPV